MIRFDPERHAYITDDNQEYLSVTKLLSKYKPAFDAETAAAKASKNRKSKWYRMDPEQIKQVWKQESDRSTTLGNPEHFLYLPSMKIAGQSDKVTVAGGRVDILDYKTNKEIKTQGFKNYEGITQKMLFPVNHLDDCNLNHYTLQLSIYMYVILKHNPLLRAGNLTLQHIIFEEEFDKDPYGYPIYTKDEHGNPIIKNIVQYKLPYLKDEVISLLQDYNLTKKS